jgi:hypothetical protein
MRSFEELRAALSLKIPLVWNDPNPVPGNDYTITWVEDTTQFIEEDTEMPILIYYGNGSEAQVFLHEIIKK